MGDAELCPKCGVEWMGTSCGADCGWTWRDEDDEVECRDCGKSFALAPGAVIGHGYVLCPECAAVAA